MFNSIARRVRGPGLGTGLKTTCILLVLVLPRLAQAGTATVWLTELGSIEQSIELLQKLVPKAAPEYCTGSMDELVKAVTAIDLASAETVATVGPDGLPGIFNRINRLSAAKDAIDKSLNGVLEQRVEFAELEPAKRQAQAVRNYLQFTSKLIDLSGRLHYELAAAINDAAFQFASQTLLRDELIDQLIVLRSGIGASIMSWALLDPPGGSPNRAQPATPATKIRLLAMIAWSGRTDALPVIVQFLKSGQATPELIVSAAETIRQLGLPQDARPGGDPRLPPPAITAVQLQRILVNLDARTLNRDLALRRAELLNWLDQRKKSGLEQGGYQLGRHSIKPGDWLLMRNASPYNLFTSLAPGLFTHVSVVTTERDPNGYERIVVVEVTERAKRIATNNVDSVLDTPLHYAFLRHEDPAVTQTISETAASLINNELEYDMTFDTARVTELAGKPLAGQRIKTYCAGLPLLCAQVTRLNRQEFFPIPEVPAAGRTVANLNKLGIRFGADLVSPTGSLFARRMQMALRSEPMYAPDREVEQGIYDYLAMSVMNKEMTPTSNLFQSLRTKLADASKSNPMLARALAAAAGVSAETDLVTAARTLAVIETLYEIATGSSRDLLAALDAVYGPAPETLAQMGRTSDEVQRIMKLRERHADLRQRAQRGQITPRQGREALVLYYTEQGRRHIDQRFFNDLTIND